MVSHGGHFCYSRNVVCFKRTQRRPATKAQLHLDRASGSAVCMPRSWLRTPFCGTLRAATRFSRGQGPSTKDDEYDAV